MRVRPTVRSNTPGLSLKPGAIRRVSGRAKTTARVVSTPSMSTSQTRADRGMAKARSSPSSSRIRVKTGTKAMVMEPSANSRRIMLGSPVGHVEGVGRNAGAEHVGQDHVTEEAQDAGKEGGAADNGGVLGDLSDVVRHRGIRLRREAFSPQAAPLCEAFSSRAGTPGFSTHFWQRGQKVDVRPATLTATSVAPQAGQASPALP